MIKATAIVCTTNVVIPCRSFLGALALSGAACAIFKGGGNTVAANKIAHVDTTAAIGPRHFSLSWPIEVDVAVSGLKTSAIYVGAAAKAVIVYVSQ
jgi:hypothetical protein